MKELIKKEVYFIINSGIGLILSLVFFLISGALLWLIPGNYNILDGGYATPDSIYNVFVPLLLIFTPALTMRLIADEKRTHTFDLLCSKPISITKIILSKWFSSIIFILFIFSASLIYIFSIYQLGSPVGNIDIPSITITYLSLILLSILFIGIGIFASSTTSNQIIAFIGGLIISFIFLYGFNLISSLVSDNTLRSTIMKLSLSFHFDRMRKGLLYINDILILSSYIGLTLGFIKIILENIKTRSTKILLYSSSALLIVGLLYPSTHFDVTSDKRYTLDPLSIELMKKIGSEKDNELRVDIYLSGNLNYSFNRLQEAVIELLDNLNENANNKLIINTIDPLSINTNKTDLPNHMAKHDMPAIQLNEVDRNGKITQQLIYPYIQIVNKEDTLTISLLKNIPGNSAEENLNASIENLEFEFTDAFQLVTNRNSKDIAFIEGHGELSQAYLYEAETALAKYFNINRGQLGTDVTTLDNFKVVIIAGATSKYSETEKFILDQYLMKGGRIFWLIDGAYVSYDDIQHKGESPSMKNETNLDDQLFSYGIRINPNFVQDAYCATIPVESGNGTGWMNLPWYYSPMLIPLQDNPITKDISPIKSSFVSSLSLVNQTNHSVNPKVLLTTSDKSHLIKVPEMISLDVSKIQTDPEYFDTSFIPVAISAEGIFNSAFINRMIPENIDGNANIFLDHSKPTKIIVVSSSDIIKNELQGEGQNTISLPLGYDKLSKKTYGNKEFIVNAVNWLAHDNEWMQIRNKSRQMNLLDKQKIYSQRDFYVILNIITPILFVGLIITIIHTRRKYKYTKK